MAPRHRTGPPPADSRRDRDGARARPPPPAPDPDWKRYWTPDEGAAYLRGLADRHPSLVRLHDAGASREGRRLWVAELTNDATGPAAGKPALYVDGGIHGNEISGPMVALYTAGYLAERYGTDPLVTELLDTRVFYIRPFANPDAASRFLSGPHTANQPRRNLRPADDDLDGLMDEDPYEDLDGDGEIGLMRRRDPVGRWRIHPADPRLLEEVPPDAPPGGWTLLGLEGVDNDGDGRLNEDGPGGVDLARNFPARWSPVEGSPYPLSEPESLSVAAFLLGHPNIAAVHHYHNFGDKLLFAVGPASRGGAGEDGHASAGADGLDRVRVEPGLEPDLEACRVLAARGADMTGCRALPAGGLGQFVSWAYEHYGAWSVLSELWDVPTTDSDGPATDPVAQLRWADREIGPEAWIPWRPFRHPRLGDVEIGGAFKKLVRRNPPPARLEDLCLKNCRYSLYLARQLPEVKITSVRLRPLEIVGSSAKIAAGEGENAFRLIPRRTVGRSLAWLEARVRNTRLLPTATRRARLTGVAVPDRISLELGPGAALATAGTPRAEASETGGLRLLEMDRADLGTLEGYEERTVSWLVAVERGEPAVAVIRVISEKGGTDVRTVRLHLDDTDVEAK